METVYQVTHKTNSSSLPEVTRMFSKKSKAVEYINSITNQPDAIVSEPVVFLDKHDYSLTVITNVHVIMRQHKDIIIYKELEIE